jgi:hypothetical protein
MLWKTGELIAPTVEYAADAAKDFHSHDTTVNTVCALPPVAFRFVNFFLKARSSQAPAHNLRARAARPERH